MLGQLTNAEIGFAIADGFWLVGYVTMRAIPVLFTLGLLIHWVRKTLR